MFSERENSRGIFFVKDQNLWMQTEPFYMKEGHLSTSTTINKVCLDSKKLRFVDNYCKEFFSFMSDLFFFRAWKTIEFWLLGLVIMEMRIGPQKQGIILILYWNILMNLKSKNLKIYTFL